MKKVARFGSVTWQDEQSRKIMRKMAKGEPLDGDDRAFIGIQMFHNIRKKR